MNLISKTTILLKEKILTKCKENENVWAALMYIALLYHLISFTFLLVFSQDFHLSRCNILFVYAICFALNQKRFTQTLFCVNGEHLSGLFIGRNYSVCRIIKLYCGMSANNITAKFLSSS